MRLSQVGLKEGEKPPSTGGGASGWIKGFFANRKSKTDVIEFKPDNAKDSENSVELPKGETEKAEDILKDKKGKY